MFIRAIKAMIWHAVETFNATQGLHQYKRSKLMVLTHSLANTGHFAHIREEFDRKIPQDKETVTLDEYLAIVDVVISKIENDDNKSLLRSCLVTVSDVCWELYYRVRLADGLPSLMTESSAKVWWRLFNTFAERADDDAEIAFPVTMDWEEVDYWVNVALKIMALPTNFTRKEEKDIMENKTLHFIDSLQRFNTKLNEHDGIYVYMDEKCTMVDNRYIEQAVLEIQDRVFDGVYINGYLGKCKKNVSSTQKWCTLTKDGLCWGVSHDTSEEKDSKNRIVIHMDSKIEHSTDKLKRPIRFSITNVRGDKESVLFEASNSYTRNKWFTALLCVRDKKIPEYDKDFITRRRNRRKQREQEREIKTKVRNQREQNKAQLEQLHNQLEAEKEHFAVEQSKLQIESAEQLRLRVLDYEDRLDQLKATMSDMEKHYQATIDQMQLDHQTQMDALDNKMAQEKDSFETERSKMLMDNESSLQQTIENYESKLAELRKQMDELKNENAVDLGHLQNEKQNALDELSNRHECEKSQLVTEHEKTQVSLRAEIDRLQQLIQEGKSEQERLDVGWKEQLKSVEDKMIEGQSALQNEIRDITNRLTEAQNHNKNLESMVEELNHQVTNVSFERKELQQQLVVKQDEFEKSNKELQKNLKETVAALNSLENKNNATKLGPGDNISHRGEGFKAVVRHMLDSSKS